MLYFHHTILCLFLTSNYLFPLHNGNEENNYRTQAKKEDTASKIPLKTDPLSPPPIPSDIQKKLFPQKEEFDEDEIEEMEMVLEAAPLKAQFIPKHLEDPKFFPKCKEFRTAYFIGAPGTGKTIAAKAIAYKMSQKGWDYAFISSTSLVDGYRNQTSVNIREELESIVASGKPTLIIIDEIGRLLENTESKNHDTDMSATALWSFLDTQLKNPNFFLIGTMNSAEKLPQPLKNRINSNSIQFLSQASPELKIKHLRKRLTDENCSLHTEVTDNFLKKELEKIDDCYGRSLLHLATNIIMLHKIDTNETSLIITKKSILNGINEYVLNEKMLKTNTKIETDEERQERHHQENIAVQNKHHTENIIANVIGSAVGNIAVTAIKEGGKAIVRNIWKSS